MRQHAGEYLDRCITFVTWFYAFMRDGSVSNPVGMMAFGSYSYLESYPFLLP